MNHGDWAEVAQIMGGLWPKARFTEVELKLWRKRLGVYRKDLVVSALEETKCDSVDGKWVTPPIGAVLARVKGSSTTRVEMTSLMLREQEWADYYREHAFEMSQMIGRLDDLGREAALGLRDRWNKRRGGVYPGSESDDWGDWPKVMVVGVLMMYDGEIDDRVEIHGSAFQRTNCCECGVPLDPDEDYATRCRTCHVTWTRDGRRGDAEDDHLLAGT